MALGLETVASAAAPPASVLSSLGSAGVRLLSAHGVTLVEAVLSHHEPASRGFRSIPYLANAGWCGEESARARQRPETHARFACTIAYRAGAASGAGVSALCLSQGFTVLSGASKIQNCSWISQRPEKRRLAPSPGVAERKPSIQQAASLSAASLSAAYS